MLYGAETLRVAAMVSAITLAYIGNTYRRQRITKTQYDVNTSTWKHHPARIK